MSECREKATDGPMKADAKPLGLVWINCCYPVLARGLATILKTEANFIWRYESRADKSPSIVVYCSESEDYTQELQRLQKLLPNTPILILVLPGKVDMSYAWQALQMGIAGFIHPEMEPLEVVQALYSASKGDVVIPNDLATALLQNLVKRRELSAELGALTYRKREILNLVAEGLTNAQIAKQLFLSEFTVKQHLRAAYKALGVRNRTEAVKLLQEKA